jgi:hypothetical protein
VRRGDRGSAVVDFALVGALLTVLFVALLQFAMLLHVRNTLADCAIRGAGYGALADLSPADGAARARQLVRAEFGAGYAAEVSARRSTLAGLDVIEVTIRAPLPLAGLLGPRRGLTVTGHALAEEAA